jgi:mannan endo-1,4-beta-mannosidase
MRIAHATSLLLLSLLGAGAAPAQAQVAGPASRTPVDPQATARTRAEYAWLVDTWGKKTIAGQQDLTWDDRVDMAQRVFDVTGRWPALMGFDFMNAGTPDRDGGSGLHQVEEAIAWAQRGGLVAFCWHWRDPALLGTPDAARANFYAREADPRKNTGFTIPMRDGQLDTSSPAYRQIDAGIDLIAAQLKRLQDAGITVLWRPLHEASGNGGDGWFWWGRKRSDGVAASTAYIQLYRHMFERLVRVHGLHNLIWVWNGQDAAWYPGDDVVDIVGWDVYDDQDHKTYGAQAPIYRKAAAIPGVPKPVALSENSFIPDPRKMAKDGARWLWFMTWNDARAGAGVSAPDNFWSGEYYNTDVHKRAVYHDPDVITLDKLPPFLKPHE